jgi:glyoxylase-like metal-dependent hydrolase (beta-lactamase superfamily II)
VICSPVISISAGRIPSGRRTRLERIIMGAMLTSARTAIVLACLCLAQAPAGTAVYEAYAVRFGILPAFPVSSLVAGADRARRLDIPVMVWLLKGGNGHTVLIDAGFYRQKFLDQWHPRDFRSPAAAVEAAGVKPDAITDVIVSHAHWDHVDGAGLFPKATIWIQRAEYEYYTGEAWQRNQHGGVDAEDMLALVEINTQGRLRFVEGDDREVLPGIRCYTGGKHTHESQYCTVRTAEGIVVFTSDNVYLYENFDTHAPIAQTVDGDAGRASNLAAQDRAKSLASSPRLIVPGHDPAVFDRFERVADGIVRIR